MGSAFIPGFQRLVDDFVREEFATRRQTVGNSCERGDGDLDASDCCTAFTFRKLGTRSTGANGARDARLVSAGGVSFLL